MSTASSIFAVLAAAIALFTVVDMLRRKRVRERHAIWWLLAAGLALLVSAFPVTLEWAATLLGIKVPANLAFFASIVILFLVTVQHSAELTALEEKVRILAERVALSEDGLRSDYSKTEQANADGPEVRRTQDDRGD